MLQCRPSSSLSWKLTISFFVFGIVVSYASFVVVAGAAEQALAKSAARRAAAAAQPVAAGMDIAYVEALEGAPASNFYGLVKSLRLSSYARTAIVYVMPAGSGWKAFSVPAGSSAVESSLAGNRTARTLDALEPGSARLVGSSRGRPFGPAIAAIGLPPGRDATRWAVGIAVGRTDFAEFLAENGFRILLLAAVLVAASFAVGRFFALRLTASLRGLASAAAAYAAGGTVVFDRGRRDEIGALSRALDDMKSELEAGKAELEERLRAMTAMNRIDRAVLSGRSGGALLEEVSSVAASCMEARCVSIALRESDPPGWRIAAHAHGPGREPDHDLVAFIGDHEVPASVRARWTEYVDVPADRTIERVGVPARVLSTGAEGRLVAVPLKVDGCCLGSLVVALDERAPLPAEKSRVVSMIADQAAVALRSARERDAMEDNFMGVIQALTRAIDAKSRWTAGHSERVAASVVRLARAAGLDEAEIRSLRIAAILHDCGKIGVSEAVLDKPGKLTAEEFALIKLHPTLGGKMIEGIKSFERMAPAIIHHHERWDGSGYPDGLAGEAIPLWARIIAVCDIWDAITDDRPYRKGMPLEDALLFMEAQAGTGLDPRLVEAFLAAESLPAIPRAATA